MENRAYALATGVFVLALGALLIATVLWLTHGTSDGVPYDLITRRSVAGLTPGAVVRLRGVEVGKVERIGFDPKDRRQVAVRARISRDTLLMQGTWAHLASLGLSGAPYIELGYPEDASLVLHTSEDSPTRIPLTPTGLAQLTEASDELMRNMGQTLARLNTVLTPENSRKISELLNEGNAAAARIRVLAEELQPAARGANQLITRSNQVLGTAQRTVEHADEVLVAARAHDGPLNAIAGSAQGARELEDRLLADTLPGISELAVRLERNSDTLEQLLRELRDRPQSVIFGSPPGAPGPGEPGFQAPPRPPGP